VSLYAYPAVLYALAPSSVAILFVFRRRIATAPTNWLGGLAIALGIACPFLLFLLANYWLHRPLALERFLPFSIPMLSATRLSQIDRPFLTTVFENLTFIVGGYRDDAIWHQSRFFLPLTGAAPYLTAVGAVTLGRRWWATKEPQIVLIVVAAIVVPIALVPLQLTRLNWFYIPSLIVAAYFLVNVAAPYGGPIRIAWALYLTVFSGLFYAYYFTSYNQEAAALDRNLGNGFRLGLEGSLRAEVALARPDEPIFVDIGTAQPYLYVLFYGLADVESFQASRQVDTVDGVYKVSRFDRFFFTKEAIPENGGFVFVSRANNLPCLIPEILTSGQLWATGRCPTRAR
jgi:hypothetical protein